MNQHSEVRFVKREEQIVNKHSTQTLFYVSQWHKDEDNISGFKRNVLLKVSNKDQLVYG